MDPNKIVPHSQRNCIEFALNAKPVRRYIPKNPIQYKLWAFATSPACEYTVFAAIMLNTLSLAMKYYQQPKVKTICTLSIFCEKRVEGGISKRSFLLKWSGLLKAHKVILVAPSPKTVQGVFYSLAT